MKRFFMNYTIFLKYARFLCLKSFSTFPPLKNMVIPYLIDLCRRVDLSRLNIYIAYFPLTGDVSCVTKLTVYKQVYLSESISREMLYCVAFNCKSGSGQGVGLFEFPKDDKRRKVWISRIKRKDFNPSKTSRLCSKHFTNDQIVVDPSLAMTIGYKLKKLQLKPDAIPSIFDFESKQQECQDKVDSMKVKRKQRQSGAVAKRKRIETLAQILKESSDSDQNDNASAINEGKETPEESDTVTGQNQKDCYDHVNETARYNASCQTRTIACKNSSCQTEP